MDTNLKCACGYRRTTGDTYRQRHASMHLTYWEGAPLGWQSNEQFIVVSSDDPWSRRRAAYRLGRAYQLEMGYDFVQFPYMRLVYPLQMALLAIDQRLDQAIGMLLWHPGKGWVGADDRDQRNDEVVTVGGLWVCAERRGLGVGSEMLIELARRWGVEIHEMAFVTPFSRSGSALIRKHVGNCQVRLSSEVDA